MKNWNIEEFRDELAEIVNIDSGSNNKTGVGSIGKYMARKLADSGLSVQTYNDFTGVEARTHTDCEAFDVLLVGHMDTVFPDGTAALRPYTEKDGFAYGPGVCDMKGGLIMILHLIRRIISENHDIRLCVALNGDEEIGSIDSKEWIQNLARSCRYALVFEPGRNGTAFVRSRKGCMDVEIDFHGKASHAGVDPEKGANAILEMANWITALSALQSLPNGTSVSAGIVSGGNASNVIPDYAHAVFDIRYTSIDEMNRVQTKLDELANNITVPGVVAYVKIASCSLPMTPSDATYQLIEKLNKIAADLEIEISWADTGGTSDANSIAGIGIPTLCGCGPVGGEMHSDKEFLELSSIEKRLNLIYRLLTEEIYGI